MSKQDTVVEVKVDGRPTTLVIQDRWVKIGQKDDDSTDVVGLDEATIELLIALWNKRQAGRTIKRLMQLKSEEAMKIKR